MIKKFIKNYANQKQEQRKAELYRNLLRHEARIGGQLFGPVPEGGRREFFCLDPKTWVWHEEWVDKNGQRQTKTTRYDVRSNTILKAQEGRHYQQVEAEEAQHLFEAAKLYVQRVDNEIYHYV